MTNPDNPVARLHQILVEACSQDASSGVGEVWAEVLRIDVNDTRRLLVGIAEVVTLVYEARRHLEQLGVDPTLFLAPFSRIELVFTNLSLGQKWSDRRKYLDANTMLALKFGVDKASSEGVQAVPAPSEEELRELQSQVESLLEEVVEIELPDDLRAVLVQKLEEIRAAILAYRVTGRRGLRQALEASLGAMLLYTTELGQARQQDSKTRKFLTAVGRLLNRLAGWAVPGVAEGLASGLVGHLLQAGGS